MIRSYHVGLFVDKVSDEAVPAAVVQRAPAAVLHAHQLVRKAQLLRQLLQQIDAEAAAALVQRAVAVRRTSF